MEQAARKTGKDRPLVVSATFEPNRLAGECLANAYERILPIMSRGVRFAETQRTDPGADWEYGFTRGGVGS